MARFLLSLRDVGAQGIVCQALINSPQRKIPTQHRILSMIRGLLLLGTIQFLAGWGCKNDLPDAPPKGAAWITFDRGSVSKLPSNRINAIFVDASNRVWFGTDSGAAAFKRNTWIALKDSLIYYERDLARWKVTAIVEAKDGGLWFG